MTADAATRRRAPWRRARWPFKAPRTPGDSGYVTDVTEALANPFAAPALPEQSRSGWFLSSPVSDLLRAGDLKEAAERRRDATILFVLAWLLTVPVVALFVGAGFIPGLGPTLVIVWVWYSAIDNALDARRASRGW